MLPGAPQPFFSPARSRPLVTAFPSPATAAAFRGLHSGVKGPGLPLRFPLPGFHRPFGPSAPLPPAGSPRPRQLLRFSPLRLPPARSAGSPPASTPLRDFYLPRDQSVQQIPPPRGSPSESARFPLAPRSPVLFLESGCGSPFLVRYVSGGLLFLKPLGTFSICPHNGLWSILF